MGEGQGFAATRKCEKAFGLGVLALGVGLITCFTVYLCILDGVIIAIGTAIFFYTGYCQTAARLLVSSSSIIHYWRRGRGHKSGMDPYLLDIPMERIQQKANQSRIIHALLQAGNGEKVVPRVG